MPIRLDLFVERFGAILYANCMQIMKKAPTSIDVSASFSALPLLFKVAAQLQPLMDYL